MLVVSVPDWWCNSGELIMYFLDHMCTIRVLLIAYVRAGLVIYAFGL